MIYGGPIIWSYTESKPNPYYLNCGAPGVIVGLKFRFNDIIDFYKTGYVQILAVRNVAGYYDYCSSPYTTYFSQELREKITWEILGRVCHLLADVSVPAHSHNDQHDPYLGGGYDTYEQYMENNNNYTQWSYSHGIAQGGLINVINKTNPIKYLFYSTAQVSNHFPSDHNPGNNTNGINDAFSNYTELAQMYSAFGDPPPGVNSQQIASSSYVFAMRSIAGLLYWFSVNAQILPSPLEAAYLSGDFTLYAGGTGHWYVQLRNGIEPFTYNWQIMYLDGAGYLQTYESVKKEKKDKEKIKDKDGDIIINAAPSNEWVPVGTNSPYFSKPHNPYDLRDFKLRCIVKDASNTTKTSNEWYVDVVSYSPEFSVVQNSDNNEQAISLAKENEVAPLPHSFSLDQNYPNPFNPSTRITYSLPEANFVTLKIYDILGREVVTLANEVKPAGKHEVEFNASELPSGTYVYKLTAGNYQTIRKMLLIK
ncbi:MAG: T9SS type A sorting domain-containing protein [Bacteroidota bacterium]